MSRIAVPPLDRPSGLVDLGDRATVNVLRSVTPAGRRVVELRLVHGGLAVDAPVRSVHHLVEELEHADLWSRSTTWDAEGRPARPVVMERASFLAVLACAIIAGMLIVLFAAGVVG
jgi:hypothetical protein